MTDFLKLAMLSRKSEARYEGRACRIGASQLLDEAPGYVAQLQRRFRRKGAAG